MNQYLSRSKVYIQSSNNIIRTDLKLDPIHVDNFAYQVYIFDNLGNLCSISYLRNDDCPINFEEINWNSLQNACKLGHSFIVNLILDHTQIEICTRELEIACKFGHASIVKKLLTFERKCNNDETAGQTLNFPEKYDEVLCIVAKNNNVEIAKILCGFPKEFYDSNEKPLIIACTLGFVEIATLLIKKCAILQKNIITKVINIAIENGKLDILKLLFANYEIDKTQFDIFIAFAIKFNQKKIIYFLCDNENITFSDKHLLQWIFRNGNNKMFQKIIKLHDDSIQFNVLDNSPLINACRNQNCEMIEFLIGCKEVDLSARQNLPLRILCEKICRERNSDLFAIVVKLLHPDNKQKNDKLDPSTHNNQCYRLAKNFGRNDLSGYLLQHREVNLIANSIWYNDSFRISSPKCWFVDEKTLL